MNKEQAKEKIKKLVEKYKKLSEAEKKGYNEQQTGDYFILTNLIVVCQI